MLFIELTAVSLPISLVPWLKCVNQVLPLQFLLQIMMTHLPHSVTRNFQMLSHLNYGQGFASGGLFVDPVDDTLDPHGTTVLLVLHFWRRKSNRLVVSMISYTI